MEPKPEPRPLTLEERVARLETLLETLLEPEPGGVVAELRPSLEDQHRGFVERIRAAEGDRAWRP
jgi:hypothetical protein